MWESCGDGRSQNRKSQRILSEQKISKQNGISPNSLSCQEGKCQKGICPNSQSFKTGKMLEQEESEQILS